MKFNHSSVKSFGELIRYIHPWRTKARFAALFSTFFAGEILGLYGWIGGFIVVLGVVSSGIKKAKK